ncbi:MAG: phage shock protein operon transcriptional activator [Acidobacteriota bacterium]|nr:phage shock protein operon transcriptional activator [Acidobacteriota bacterium]
MVGESEPFLDTMQRVSRAARVNRPVLIIGERGTGKELVAARLHYLSPRWQQPRIAINCAAFNENLLEAEIFGYEAGAFTGAVRSKRGRFELANGGSLFLDELAQSPMALQEKLLRVLEYQEFERVGGTETIQVNVRVIAATNQDLPTLCEEGTFRDDLLDRLSFEVITLPPLRHRKDDIPLLIRSFAVKMAQELEMKSLPAFGERAFYTLMDYDWPGNIRELKNVVERAVYQSQGDPIEEIMIDPFDSPYRPNQRIGIKEKEQVVIPTETRSVQEAKKEKPSPPGDSMALPEAVERLEREMVTQALEKHQFNQKKAAETLGVSYYQLRRILKRLELP